MEVIAKVLNGRWGRTEEDFEVFFCDFGFVVDYFFGSKQVTPNLVAKILNDGWMEGRRKERKNRLADSHHAVL